MICRCQGRRRDNVIAHEFSPYVSKPPNLLKISKRIISPSSAFRKNIIHERKIGDRLERALHQQRPFNMEIRSLAQVYYRPTTSTTKLPGTSWGRRRGFSGVGAGRGPNSAVIR